MYILLKKKMGVVLLAKIIIFHLNILINRNLKFEYKISTEL